MSMPGTNRAGEALQGRLGVLLACGEKLPLGRTALLNLGEEKLACGSGVDLPVQHCR